MPLLLSRIVMMKEKDERIIPAACSLYRVGVLPGACAFCQHCTGGRGRVVMNINKSFPSSPWPLRILTELTPY
ncbi:hypothetical protein DOA20_22315 [Salmonella enterica subsp. enterica serovar Newport]|nr:hypothetical protein [Salmonella enterica subsp. enterica serovar Newport]